MVKSVDSVAKPGFRSQSYMMLGQLLNFSVKRDNNSALPQKFNIIWIKSIRFLKKLRLVLGA